MEETRKHPAVDEDLIVAIGAALLLDINEGLKPRGNICYVELRETATVFEDEQP